jgi:hypothetical protein
LALPLPLLPPQFMTLVNATWPHPDHVLINNGIPGTAFYAFATGD